MPRSRTYYPEIQEIKEDLDSLKSNVVELTRHIQEEGADHTHAIAERVAERARKRISDLQSVGRREISKMERRIKAEPAKSLAIAFAVGAVASAFLSRRG